MKRKRYISKVSNNDLSYLSTNTNLGIQNLGNTCYANSVLQCLFFTYPLVSIIFNYNILEARKYKFLLAFMHLVKTKWNSEESILVPRNFVGNLVDGKIEVGDQQDSVEFLTFLLSKLDEIFLKISGKRKSEVYKIFGITVKSELTCSNCNNITSKKQDELILPLSIRSNKDIIISNLLKRYLKFELIDFSCDKCKKNNISFKKQNILISLPNVLIIQLSRFKFSKKSGNIKKITNKVKIEKTLVFDESSIYDLYAVIIHMGSYGRGHYISVINKGVFNNNKIDSSKQFYMFNDEKVCKINEKLFNQVSSNGYIFFYKKRENLSKFCNIIGKNRLVKYYYYL